MLDLSPEQKAAVQYVKGPLLVVGGAGSGKTSLLTYKIAWLLREYDVDPAAILTLTANTYAARRIRVGVRAIVGRSIASLSISTFSEFALAVVQRRPEAVGLRAGFSVYDQTEGEAVVARLLRETLPQALALAGDVWRGIAAWKRGPGSPPAGSDSPELNAPEIAKRLYPTYEQRLRTANAIDIVGLARQAARLLALEAALLPEGHRHLRFLLVDEYEQTGSGEHEIVRLLAAEGGQLTAVGDDTPLLRQHAGTYDNLTRLQSDLPDVRVLRLVQNHRSTGRILKALDCLSGSHPAESAASIRRTRAAGAPLQVLRVRSEQHEAESVVRALIDHKFRHGTDYRDYGILFGRTEQAAPLARALQAYRVPYYLRDGSDFFGQPEIRDFCAYLRLLGNPADDNAFLRVIGTPRRDIDHDTLERLMRFAAARERCLLEAALDSELAQTLAPGQCAALQAMAKLLRAMIERAAHAEPVQLTRDLLTELRYEEWLRDTCNDFHIAAQRMQNVMRVVDMLDRLAQKRPGVGLRTLAAELNLNSVFDPPGEDPVSDAVVLAPLASTRGMEFTHVYLLGLEKALGLEEALGLAAQESGKRDPEEERSLAYVGITRAREGLTLTVIEPHLPAGPAPRPIPFLAGLGPHDVEWIDAGPGGVFAESALARSPGQPGHIRRYSP